MRQLLILWLGLFLCGAASAQSPTSVAELHERWIDLLRATDGDISARTFEKVIGLELLVTTHGADGAIACMLRAMAPSAPWVVTSSSSPITFSKVLAEMSPSVMRNRSIQRSWSSATLVGD